MEKSRIGFFEKFLTLWVLLCMAVGVAIGKLMPAVPAFFNRFEIANVNVVIAVLIWLMIFPMMLKIDFSSVRSVGKNPKGLFLTWVANWVIKPFTMFGIASLFFLVLYRNVMPDIGREYLAGAVLLGAAPCTAMVFVWSSLTRGNPAYTLVQVATNDLILLFLYVPIVALQLGIGGFVVPWNTLFLSIVLFVVVPLGLGSLFRRAVIRKRGVAYLEDVVIAKFSKMTTIGLLATLVIIFSLQADLIWNNPLHILLIAIPLVLQTFLIFFLTYGGAKLLRLPHDVAAPAAMVGASNFFELAVAVAIALFPLNPGVALATIVGVLVEVPTMLILVRIANRRKERSRPMKKPEVAFICVHNACRSQIAEAIAKVRAGDVFNAHSAGTEIASQIQPDAVRVLKERIGIDMEKTQRPKTIATLPDVDIVVTMGCGVACPWLPCRHREDWNLEDPTGKGDEAMMKTIHEIEHRILDLAERIRSGSI